MRGLSIELQATSGLRGHEVGACRSPPFAPLTPLLPHMQSTLFYHCLCKVMFWIFLISSVYNSFQIALGLGQYFCHYKLLSRWVNDGLHHRSTCIPGYNVLVTPCPVHVTEGHRTAKKHRSGSAELHTMSLCSQYSSPSTSCHLLLQE